MIALNLKLQVIKALAERRELFTGTDEKFALSIGINKAQYSRIKNGETERVISDGKWISLARTLDVQLDSTAKWITAKTPVFEYIYQQLTFCQQHAASRQLCDIPDIGKTHTAKEYAADNADAVYIDCSQNKTKQGLIRFMAKSLGVSHLGKYKDVYEDLVYYVRQFPGKILFILDEAGDLTYEADLEVKALWNAWEGIVGWYKIGADGLKQKFNRRIISKKVGYTELHSRFGNSYQKPSPDGEIELKEFKMLHAAMIIQQNFPAGTDINKVAAKAEFTLRNLKDERRKLAA